MSHHFLERISLSFIFICSQVSVHFLILSTKIYSIVRSFKIFEFHCDTGKKNASLPGSSTLSKTVAQRFFEGFEPRHSSFGGGYFLGSEFYKFVKLYRKQYCHYFGNYLDVYSYSNQDEYMYFNTNETLIGSIRRG